VNLGDRFWGKVEKTDTCWVWTAGKNHYGYGSYAVRRGDGWFRAQAHRLAYEELVGPIPAGLTVDHICRNRACVNPTHMELVTRGENVLRGTGPSAEHARQTHCKRGHPFEEPHVYLWRGRRYCRTCQREREAVAV
jgi:hypothetical protein